MTTTDQQARCAAPASTVAPAALACIVLFAGVHLVAWRGTPQPQRTAGRAQQAMATLGEAIELHYRVHGLYPPGHAYSGPLTHPRGFPQLAARGAAGTSLDPTDTCIQRWYEAFAADVVFSAIAAVALVVWWCVLLARARTRGTRLSPRQRLAVTGIVIVLAAIPLVAGLVIVLPASVFALVAIYGVVRHPARFEESRRRLILTLAVAIITMAPIMVSLWAVSPHLGAWSLHWIGPRADFRYATDGRSYIVLQSTGPDLDYDVDLAVEADGIRAATWEPELYSPANGALSSGDLILRRP